MRWLLRFNEFPQTPQAVWSRKAPEREPSQTRWARRGPRLTPRDAAPEPGITSPFRSPAAPAVRTGPERPPGGRAGGGQERGGSGQAAAGRQRAPSALAPAAARRCRGGGRRRPRAALRCQRAPHRRLRPSAPGGRPALREGRGRSTQPRGAGERG